MGKLSRRQFIQSLAVAGSAGLLVSCENGNQNSGNLRNSTGGIYTPDGKVEHFIAPEERGEGLFFEGQSLADEGVTISLNDFSGEIVVVNAWGQWCAPCRAEVDDLETVHKSLQSRKIGSVLGINVRDYNPEIARDFVKDNGVTYPSIYDPPFKIAASLGGIPPSVIPSTVVLDTHHRQAAVFIRAIGAAELMDVIQKLVDETHDGASE